MADSTTTAVDLATTCWTCEPLQKYSDQANGFAQSLSDALQTPMVGMFLSLAGFWIVLAGYRYFFQMVDLGGIIKELVFVSIAALLLGGQGPGLIEHIYQASLSIMGSAASVAFKVAGGTLDSTGYTGVIALAANGERAIAKVFKVAETIALEGNAFNPINYVYAAILVVPYFLLIVAYASQVVVSIFRVMMVATFAPFLFMAFAFNWGRSMAQSGAKTLLATIMVLFASTAALAVAIFGVNSAVLDTSGMTSEQINAYASLSNPAFLVVIFLGWIGTAFIAEGTSVANSIAQTALTNTAAGIMTAGASATALMAGKKASEGLGRLVHGGKGGQKDGGNASGGEPQSRAQALIDRFKNINKPGGGS